MVKDNDSDRDNGNSREIFNRRQGEIFDKVAQSFDRLKPPDVEEKLEDIVKSAQIKAGDVILDVGSGTGALLAPILKAMPSKVVACDLSREMLAQAKEKYGSSVKYVQRDVIDLPGKEGPFDVVFCNAMFGNIYDQQLALQAIHTLLKEGGRLIISHPMGKDFVRRLKELRPETIKELLPGESEIGPLVEPEGFKVIQFVDEPEFYLAIAEKV
jgi:ubiquinone/menaquinone biosynthesis C-methylase UbiE